MLACEQSLQLSPCIGTICHSHRCYAFYHCNRSLVCVWGCRGGLGRVAVSRTVTSSDEKKEEKKKQKFGSISSLLTSIRQDARFCFQEIFINKMYLMWCNPEKISVDAFVSGLNSQGTFPSAIYVVLRHAIQILNCFGLRKTYLKTDSQSGFRHNPRCLNPETWIQTPHGVDSDTPPRV